MDLRARLSAVVEAVNPPAATEHAEHGTWPGGSAPYVIDELRGQQRIRVTSADGDVIAGVGPTKDAALAVIEAKLNIAPAGGQ